MTGGKWLAEERGAFDLAEGAVVAIEAEDAVPVATAKLFEVAAAHDGQPAAAWLRVFLSTYQEEAA